MHITHNPSDGSIQTQRAARAGSLASLTKIFRIAGLALLAIILIGACATTDSGWDGASSATGEVPAQEPEAPVAESSAAPVVVPQEESVVEFVGVWEGSLKVPGGELGITVKFITSPVASGPMAAAVATIDIPAQGAYGLALSNVNATGDTPGAAIHFELAVGGPTLIADGMITPELTIAATFSQGPASGEINLSRISDLSEVDIPSQAPETETEVSIQTDGLTINGTLRLPTVGPGESATQVPLVVIVAGSGPTDRDGNSAILPGRNDSLKLLAAGLAEHGIASLRYDKRGIAGSAYEGMREEDLRFGDLVNDLNAWVVWASARDDISAVFVAGHSEGGLAVLGAAGSNRSWYADLGIDPETAPVANDAIAGVITIAGPGRTLDDIVLEQLEGQLGADSPLYDRSVEISAAINEGRSVGEVPPELASLFRPSVQPYLRSVFQYDPITLATSMSQPLLVVTGTEDLQVPVADAQALSDARPDATLVIVSGMNHVLKMVPPADPAANQQAYMDPSFELSGELVGAIAEFVLAQ